MLCKKGAFLYSFFIFTHIPAYSRVFRHIQTYPGIIRHILCGFRKAHSTQHALFKLLQAWQEELDKGGFLGRILMDLSKVYDCLPHDLLVAKLEAYGVGKAALNLIVTNITSETKNKNRFFI